MLSSLFSAYPSFLVFLGFIVATALTMALMPAWIRLLTRTHIGQQVRADGPQSHLVKQGTPTMGGVIMLIAIVITVLLVVPPSWSFVAQFAIATLFTLYVVNWLGIAPTVQIPFLQPWNFGVLTTSIPCPICPDGSLDIPWLYLVFCYLLIIGMSNAVNLTDGLDGLAAGTVMVVMIVMAAIAYRENMLPMAVFAATMAGACVGFLWFNAYPADIFMGDTGSLALGSALACIAIITKTEVFSLIIGGLFVAEACSVILQVVHYKRTKKRLFLMAPLHHHFEKKGWSETKVVIRFWIVSGALAGFGFVLFFIQPIVMGMVA